MAEDVRYNLKPRSDDELAQNVGFLEVYICSYEFGGLKARDMTIALDDKLDFLEDRVALCIGDSCSFGVSDEIVRHYTGLMLGSSLAPVLSLTHPREVRQNARAMALSGYAGPAAKTINQRIAQALDF